MSKNSVSDGMVFIFWILISAIEGGWVMIFQGLKIQRGRGRVAVRLAALLVATALASVASAQVFNSGQDDPSLFTNVINLPPDPNIGNDQSIGGVVGETTQLNVMDGGSIGLGFDANSGSEVNIRGGNVGYNFDANSDSEVNVSGGIVGGRFKADFGSVVNISGGTFASAPMSSSLFFALAGSEINLFGTAFFLNGERITGLTLGEAYTVGERGVTLSGVLADGSAFSFEGTLASRGGIRNTFDSDALLTVTLVPEPQLATMLLGGLYLLASVRRRERRA